MQYSSVMFGIVFRRIYNIIYELWTLLKKLEKLKTERNKNRLNFAYVSYCKDFI